MITTTPGSVYRDCSAQDFVRYFQGTLLLWNLSQTKKRIFFAEEMSSNLIRGTYLTREKEWKSKEFKFSNWWESLDTIALGNRLFNMKSSAATWGTPPGQNFKKSFNYNINSIKFFGSKIDPEDQVTQEIVHKAFGEVYGQPPLPSLPTVVLGAASNPVSQATREGFVVDPVKGALYFRGHTLVGRLRKDGRITLPNSTKFLLRPILNSGVPSDLVMVDKEGLS